MGPSQGVQVEEVRFERVRAEGAETRAPEPRGPIQGCQVEESGGQPHLYRERAHLGCMLNRTNYKEKDECAELIAHACKQTEEQTDIKLVINQSNNGSIDQPRTGDVFE